MLINRNKAFCGLYLSYKQSYLVNYYFRTRYLIGGGDVIDKTEQKILAALQANGRMPNVQLAELVGRSESPTFRRVKQLEESGVIQKYVALLDQRLLGLTVTAYVNVRMEKQPDSQQDAFHQCVRDEAHIIECHAMSGSFDFLMKIVARDIDHFAELCMQKILKYPGVSHVESAFSLEEIKNSHALPVE
jgi:Lrp/AsnC family leucine-responsive transcriptional regulator